MSPVTPEPHRRGARRMPRILWVAVALAALAGAAWIVLAVAFPPARLRALAERQLGATLAREVRFDDVRLGLWPPVRITVGGLALAEPGGFARGTAIRARSLHLDLDVFALFARRIVVRKLLIDEPAAHVVLRRDGTTNLDSLGVAGEPGDAAAPPMDLAVSLIEIRRGRVLVDDLTAPRRVAFGLETRMSFALEGGGARVTTAGTSRLADVAFGPLSAVRVTDLDRSLAGLEWRIEHRGAFDLAARRLALERLALKLDRAEIALEGTVDAPADGPPVADLAARGSGIDLGDVLRFLSEAEGRALKGVSGGGRLDFDLGVRGALAADRRPALTGTVRVQGGSLIYPGAPVGIENVAFAARLAPDSLSIPDLTASVSGQPVRASLAATDFADPRVAFTVRGDLDLAAVARFVAPEDTRLTGAAAVDLGGRGRAKDPAGMALDGRVRLADVAVHSPQLPRPLERISGEIEFSATRARVTGLTVHAGRSSFALDASVARPLALAAKPEPGGGYAVPPAEVDFSLRSPHLDLAELLPAAPGGPALGNARGGGRISIGRLRNKKLDAEHVTARVALEPGVLEVEDFALAAYGGRASGRARFDSRVPDRPKVTLEARVDGARADSLLGTWTGAGKLVHASLSTTINLSAEGASAEDALKSLSAEGLSLFSQGTIGPAPALERIADLTGIAAFREVRFDDVRLPFRVERGRVATGPAKLGGPYGEWALTGAVGFDGALDYAVSITLPPETVAKLGARAALVAGAIADEEGRVLIDLAVTGTAKSPKVKLDERAMRDRLVGRVSRALADQQAKITRQLRDTLGLGDRSVADSLRAAERRARRALEDSLKKAGRDLLKGFFGGRKSRSDTTP